MQDLTTGSLTGHLLKTTSFMLVSMIFQTLYVLVDLFWVGRLGTDAIAAVGLAGNLSFIVIAITQVLGVGATTLVSHASGRKDQERAIFLFNQSQVLSMVVALVVPRRRDAVASSVRRRPERDRRHAHRRPSNTCCGSFRRWRCSSRWSQWARRCAAPATSSRACACRPARS